MSQPEHLPGHRGFFDEPFPSWVVIAPPVRYCRQSTQPPLPLQDEQIRNASRCPRASAGLFVKRSVERVFVRLDDRYWVRIVDAGR